MKLHHLIYTSSAQFIPIIMDIMNSSGQIQIYLKACYIINVLKAFVHQVQKKFPELANKLNLRRIQDTFMNRLIVELQDISHGANKYRASVKDTREYKDYIILFMVPRESGVSSEIVNQLKSCLYNIFNSEHFFILMETYFSTLPGEGGKIGLHSKKKDSKSWNILKNPSRIQIQNMISYHCKSIFNFNNEIHPVQDKLQLSIYAGDEAPDKVIVFVYDVDDNNW